MPYNPSDSVRKHKFPLRLMLRKLPGRFWKSWAFVGTTIGVIVGIWSDDVGFKLVATLWVLILGAYAISMHWLEDLRNEERQWR